MKMVMTSRWANEFEPDLHAMVDLSPGCIDLVLRRMDLVARLSAADPRCAYAEFVDNTTQWGLCENWVPTSDLSHEVVPDDREFGVSEQVDDRKMIVSAAGVKWSATDYETDFSLTTPELPRSFFEELGAGKRGE